MTVTATQTSRPTVGAFSGLSPTVASGRLLLRSTQWSGSGTWGNEGLGSGLDMTLSGGATKTGGMVRLVGATDGTGEIADPNSLEPGTVPWTGAFLFTPTLIADTDTDNYVFFEHSDGTFFVDQQGLVLSNVRFDAFPPAGLVGLLFLVQDGTPAHDVLLNWTGWTAARHLVVIRLDPTGDAEMWVDGDLHDAKDMTALGSIGTTDAFRLRGGRAGENTAADNVVGWEYAEVWPRLLTDDEITDLATEWGV